MVLVQLIAYVAFELDSNNPLRYLQVWHKLVLKATTIIFCCRRQRLLPSRHAAHSPSSIILGDFPFYSQLVSLKIEILDSYPIPYSGLPNNNSTLGRSSGCLLWDEQVFLNFARLKPKFAHQEPHVQVHALENC